MVGRVKAAQPVIDEMMDEMEEMDVEREEEREERMDVGDFLEVLVKEEPGQAVEEEEVGVFASFSVRLTSANHSLNVIHVYSQHLVAADDPIISKDALQLP